MSYLSQQIRVARQIKKEAEDALKINPKSFTAALSVKAAANRIVMLQASRQPDCELDRIVRKRRGNLSVCNLELLWL